MKSIFDNSSYEASKLITKRYSTSFYAGIRCLDKKIRNDVHAIYGMVRFADEIVDTFHDYNKKQLLNLKIEDPAGVYMLIIESKDWQRVIRLVKQ